METKPGIKTTEFWLALFVAVCGGLSAVYIEDDWAKILGVLASALSSVGYGIARAQVKSNQS